MMGIYAMIAAHIYWEV